MRIHRCCSTGQIYFDDIDLEKGYHHYKAFAQSKLANVLFTRELAIRLEGMQNHVHCVCCKRAL